MAAPARLTPQGLAEQHQSGQVTLVDVREPTEYDGVHIPGSTNIPLSRLNQAALPEGPLVLICKSGNRSFQGMAQLLHQGHPLPVADLEGGLSAWQQAGFPVHKR